MVSPVRKRLFRVCKWSLIRLKCASKVLFFCSSFFTSTSFNLEYRFSISVATSLSCTNKLWPPGTLFMIWRSILSFSRIAKPPSINIGGCVASKFVRKSGGGFCMSTVVTYKQGTVIALYCIIHRHVAISNSPSSLSFSTQRANTSPWSTLDRTDKRPFDVHR